MSTPTFAFRMPTFESLRVLRRSPGFAAAAILMMAFGVGSTTAIFSIVNAQLLSPLPYRDARQIVFVRGWDVEANRLLFNMAAADYLELRDARIFSDMAGYRYWSAALTGRGMPERLQGYFVTGNTFEMLGVPAALGRTILPGDDRAGVRVAVISHNAWMRHFGGDPSIVGQQVQFDGRPFEIVGVMPESFEFPIMNFKGDVWAPYGIDNPALRARATAPWLTALARLKPGQRIDEAQTATNIVMDRLRKEFPETNRTYGANVIEMQEMVAGELRTALTAVMVAVVLLLLLACANLANLMLARGVARARELAVRAALGAGRARLIRQVLAESLVLTTAGGLLGAVIAWWLLGVLRASLPPFVTSVMPNIDLLRVEGRALAVAIGCSMATGLLAGLYPALRAARGTGGDALRVRDGAPAGSRRAASTLVAVQVALSIVLLCGAALLTRSVLNLTRVDTGFRGEGVLTMSVTLPAARYTSPAAGLQFYERALEKIAALPGVESAGAVNALPFSTYNRGGSVTLPGGERAVRTDMRAATPQYLATIGVPLVRGRAFTDADRGGAPRVVLVNREFERRYLNGEAALGSTLRLGTAPDPHTIVGIVGDVQHHTLMEGPQPEVYVPFAQQPSAFMMLAVRAASPLDQAPAVRRAIAEIDPLQPVFEVNTLDVLVDRSIAPFRQVSAIIAVFAAAAGALALIGLYALVAYSVRQRTREVGVRLALGAPRGAVVRAMMRGAIVLTSIGILIGIAGGVAATQGLKSMLYGVTAVDPITFAGVPAALLLSAALAAYIPARRAARVDPALTLRD